MATTSNEESFLSRKSRLAGEPAPRSRRRYSQVQKDTFLLNLERLGSMALAAQESGIPLQSGYAWARAAGKSTGRTNQKYSQEQKDEFFKAFDRLGTVTAAARELDVNINAAFRWAYTSGLVQKSSTGARGRGPQIPQATKDEFFTLLDRLGTVTAAARELGLDPRICFKWMSKHGLTKPRPDPARKETFLRLRAEGKSRKEAAAVVGIGKTHARHWDLGMIHRDGRYVYPDTPLVSYNHEVTSVIAEPVLVPLVSVPRLSQQVLEKDLDPRFLSVEDRELIADQRSQGTSIRGIAKLLGRSPSTISREISRNAHPTLGYMPHGAQRRAATRRARPKTRKLITPGPLKDYVQDQLKEDWSPEQISHLLIKEFPDDPSMRVSHETIYQAIYFQARGGLKRELETSLRSGRTRRKSHKNPEERTSRFRDGMINISERPAEVEDRAVPGHWEGDLITGTQNKSAIATLVERSTRYVMLVHLEGDHTAETVRDGLIKTMRTLPAHLRGSLTWDQGSEMALHKSFSMATDMDVYFCDPASPWQRGSNENTNGLLRQYFPKGTDLSIHSPEDLEFVAQKLNRRPRKTLGWDTPAERLRDLIAA